MHSLRNKAYNLLRKSESLLKTDMVYITKGGSWLVASHGAAILAGLCISIAFANLFPKESFGTYKFIISMAGVIGAFSLTGMGTAVTQAVARGFESRRQGFRINLKWSIGVLIGGLVLSVYYYANGNMLLSISFLLVGFITPITLSANLYGAYLLGKKDFRRNSFYSMAHNTIPVVAIILTLLLTDSVVAVIVVYLLSGAVTSLFLYHQTSRAYPLQNKDDPELNSYSGHLSAMSIIAVIASHLDKILIFHYLGAAPLAIYAFAIAPVEQLQGGKKILSTLILPKLSEASFEEVQRSSPYKALLLALYALCLIAVWIFAAPYFYQLLYPQYLSSVFYSQLYSLTLFAVSG